MSRFCLDTSAYSNFKRGRPAPVAAITRARWLGVPTVVLGELRTGFLLGSRGDVNESSLREFLASDLVWVLDVDDEASQIYSEMVVALRRAGTPTPINDVWIAAVAAREGATVLTSDAHFAAIPGVLFKVV